MKVQELIKLYMPKFPSVACMPSFPAETLKVGDLVLDTGSICLGIVEDVVKDGYVDLKDATYALEGMSVILLDVPVSRCRICKPALANNSLN